MAKFKSLFKYFPEFVNILLFTACRTGNINKVYCNNALIESSVILRLSVFINIWRKKASASHRSIAMTFSVFIHLKFKHNLFRYIIRNHTLSGTFSRKFRKIVELRIFCDIILFQNINKFREGRSYIYTGFVLNANDTLFQNFFNNEGKIMLFFFISCFIKIHEDCNERCLAVCCKKSNNLIL